MAHKNADLQKIEEMIEIMKKNDLVEVEIKHGDDKILLKRSSPQQPSITAVPVVSQAAPSIPVSSEAAKSPVPSEAGAAVPKDEGLVEIKSPMVGTFYATASPDSDPYVEVGSKVNPQTVICIIEAMKVMNEIKAETEGEIVEILATSGQAVEYGQVLFKVKPD